MVILEHKVKVEILEHKELLVTMVTLELKGQEVILELKELLVTMVITEEMVKMELKVQEVM